MLYWLGGRSTPGGSTTHQQALAISLRRPRVSRSNHQAVELIVVIWVPADVLAKCVEIGHRERYQAESLVTDKSLSRIAARCHDGD